ncbi:hypothetical protein LEMLEM_LOCUS10813 [Lemmus lemmus]
MQAEEGCAGEWEPLPPRALLFLCLRKQPGPSQQALNNEGQSVVLTSGFLFRHITWFNSCCFVWDRILLPLSPSMEITDVCRRHPQLCSSYLRGSEV